MRWFVQGMSLLAGRRVHTFASCVWNKIHFQHHLHRDVHDEIWRQVGSLWRAAIILTRNLVSLGANVFQYTISECPFASVQKRVLVRNHSCENVGPTSSFSCRSNFFFRLLIHLTPMDGEYLRVCFIDVCLVQLWMLFSRSGFLSLKRDLKY